jgi:CelD/BcsL family acetyltransferase involved in cellulose biosynthesis
LSADLGTYAELHESRWRGRGESRYVTLGDRLVPFFEDVARPLIDSGRFRLLMVEIRGRPICAEISLVAGGEVGSLTVGWDQHYRELGPARLALLRSIEHACEQGERRIDLCWGRFEDKQQYTDGVDAASWDSLLIPSGRLWRTLAEGASGVAGYAVRSRAERVLAATPLKRLCSLGDN